MQDKEYKAISSQPKFLTANISKDIEVSEERTKRKSIVNRENDSKWYVNLRKIEAILKKKTFDGKFWVTLMAKITDNSG